MAGVDSLDDSDLCPVRHSRILNDSFTKACDPDADDSITDIINWKKHGECAHLYENPITSEVDLDSGTDSQSIGEGRFENIDARTTAVNLDSSTDSENIVENNRELGILVNNQSSPGKKDISDRSLPAPADISDGIPLCRICHEDDEDEELVSPCFCSGSVGLLHMSCLETWLGTSETTSCEICHFRFSVVKKPRPYKWFLTNKRFGKVRRNILSDLVCFMGFMSFVIVSVIAGVVGATYLHAGQTAARTTLIFMATFSLCIFVVWTGMAIRRNYRIIRKWRQNYQTIKIHYDPPAKVLTNVDNQSGATEVTEMEPEPRVACVIESDKKNNGKANVKVIHGTPWRKRKSFRTTTPQKHGVHNFTTSTPHGAPRAKHRMKWGFSGSHVENHTPISGDTDQPTFRESGAYIHYATNDSRKLSLYDPEADSGMMSGMMSPRVRSPSLVPKGFDAPRPFLWKEHEQQLEEPAYEMSESMPV